jgi:hypothetical protein
MVLAVRQGEQCDSEVFPIAPGEPATDGVAGRGDGIQRAHDGRTAPWTLLPSNSKQRPAFVHVDIAASGGRIPTGRLRARSSETAKE